MASSYTRCPWPLIVQSFIFAKSEFDLPEAMEWMADNGVSGRPRALLETGQSWRARMHEPTEFVTGSFRTIRLGKGQSRVQAVIGCPKKHLHEGVLQGRADRKAGRPPAAAPPTRFEPLAPKAPKAASKQLSFADLLRRSPPAPGTSLRQYAAKHGVSLTTPGLRRAWKGRR